MKLKVGLLVRLLAVLQFSLSQAQQSQISFGDVVQAIGVRARDCFANRMDRVRVVTSAFTSILQGNADSLNTKVKCSSKCVLQNFGVMGPNGTLSVDTMKKLAEQIPVARIKGLVLDRIELCVEDAEVITDSCQKSVTVTVCIAKNGVLTATNLPKTLMNGLRLLPKLLQDRLGLTQSSQNTRRKPAKKYVVQV